MAKHRVLLVRPKILQKEGEDMQPEHLMGHILSFYSCAFSRLNVADRRKTLQAIISRAVRACCHCRAHR